MEGFASLCRRGPASAVCQALEHISGTEFVVRGGFAAAVMCGKPHREGLGKHHLTLSSADTHIELGFVFVCE